MSEAEPSLGNTTPSDATTDNEGVTLILYDCSQLVEDDDETESTLQPKVESTIFQLRLRFPIPSLYRFSHVPREWMLFIAEEVIGTPGTLRHSYHDRASELEDGDVYSFEVAGGIGRNTLFSIFKL